MASSATDQNASDQSRIMLGLLSALEQDGAKSQRRLAADLGIALGLLNAYLKRCVHKGLVKVTEVPARRYAYYLTPQGFAEKSRLTVEYLSVSFSFFREAKSDCLLALAAAKTRGFSRIVLAGASELAEISTLCAREVGVDIVAIVDGAVDAQSYVGIPVFKNYDALIFDFDAVFVTDQKNPAHAIAEAINRYSADRVLVPPLLGVAMAKEASAQNE